MKKLKIKSIKSLGYQEVYDISMPTNKNFVLENGIVAHNCSYATVCYIGAYLKYHYPQYFWLGELSIRSREDLDHVWDEARHFILPPDIIRSQPEEWCIEGEKLRAPLSFVKGCGTKGVVGLKRFMELSLQELVGTDIDLREDDGVVEVAK